MVDAVGKVGRSLPSSPYIRPSIMRLCFLSVGKGKDYHMELSLLGMQQEMKGLPFFQKA